MKNLKELETEELKLVEGGFFPFLVGYAVVVGLLYYAAAGAHVLYDSVTDHESSHDDEDDKK